MPLPPQPRKKADMLSLIHLAARHWWLLLLRGLLAIAFGAMALAWPGPTAAALVLLLGAYLLVDGVFGVVDCVRHWSQLHDRWLWLLDALLSLAAGIVALLMPGLTALALLLVIAAWSVVAGVLRIALAIRLRKLIEGEWWMALGGLLSIVFGVLLFALPDAGIVSLVWLIGIWALLLGAVFIALSLRLRRFGQSARGGR